MHGAGMWRGAAIMALLAAPGCAARTVYHEPPVVPAPAAFLESADWKPSQPLDASLRGNWWEMFGDQDLNALETRVDVSNETLKIAAARFDEARAAIRGARSELFPQVTVAPSIARVDPSGHRPASPSSAPYTDLVLPLDATWEADVWGRVRSGVNASRAAAQASAADLENIRLSLRAELATDYFTLKGLDREQRLLEEAVTAYERALELAQNRFRGGIVSAADVDQAETQLETTRAQAVDVQVDRAQFQHAIAVLVGQSPSSFVLSASPLETEPPAVPIGVPSDLLERRPDIASAERRMAQAGANVGVTQAAFYPLLTLGATAGFEASTFGAWLAGASNFWSVAPTLIATVFDGGRRHAVSDEAKAAFVESEAEYRLSVLSAFREVEDQLSALRLLEQEAEVQARASAAAERSLTQANNRYRGGVVTYLEVVAAQTRTLDNQRAEVSILSRRMAASVQLLKALGGGWTVASLPTD